MAIGDQVTALEIGRSYATGVQGESAAKRLWVSTHRDYVELWLLTEPIDGDTERRLYVPVVSMYEQFPEENMRFHVINPSHFTRLELQEVIPSDATELPLRPA